MVAKPSRIEVLEPDIYLHGGFPSATFEYLRAAEPVCWHPEKHGRGAWVISRYDDIVEISSRPKDFSSWRGGTNIQDYEQQDLDPIRMLMLNMDPPQHNKYRRLVSGGFRHTPRRVALMEPGFRQEAAAIIDEVIEQGSCDFVEAIAAQLPLRVIAGLLGIPQEDRAQLFHWSNRLIGFEDPEYQTSIEDARMAAAEIWGYANQLAEARRGGTGDDLVTYLINSEVDGEKLSLEDFDAFFILLSVGGNETTRNLLSGAMLTLFEHPAAWREIVKNPAVLSTAVDEFLRWVSPVNCFRRTATRDLELHGRQIKENDKVVLFYTSANRDESVFPNAHSFDIHRTPNDHLAFGSGQHHCIGSHLARLEIRIMFEEIAKRMPSLRLAGEVSRLRSTQINGVKHIPVTFDPGRRVTPH